MTGLPDYIDLHSHQDPGDAAVLTLISKYGDFDKMETGKRYSIGLHPWYIHDATSQLQQLENNISDPRVMAIGECGLDTLCATDMDLQKKVFAAQILLAGRYRKPLIIHCVKAFPEALSMLKATRVPVIFHGFDKKESLAEHILAQGHYLSFGAAILRTDGVAARALAAVPADRFFLETDDKHNIGIREIYEAASFIRKTGKDAIILQLQKNFQKVLPA